MKVCTRCHIEKDDSEFRIRVKKGSSYLNPTCRKCDAEIAKIYYDKKKDDSEFKQKNIVRARNYLKANYDKVKHHRKTAEYLAKHNEWEKKRYEKYKDFINERQKLRRQTTEYKSYMKEYRQKRRDIIFEQEKITKKRYLEKNRDSVSDEYCIHKIMNQKKFKRVAITHQMIETKRIQILIKRLRNKIAKTKKNEKYNNS